MSEMTIAEKVNLIEAMNMMVIADTDENKYERWITIVPDQATVEDFEEIAEDKELFDATIEQFCKIFKMKLYFVDKWYN